MNSFEKGLVTGLWIAIVIMIYTYHGSSNPEVPQREPPECQTCNSLEDGWPVVRPKVINRPGIRKVNRK